jgi:N-acetylglutamate synthase-like GNAT family acetyltransferase
MDIRIEPFEERYREDVGTLIVSIQQREFDVPITYEQQPDLRDIAGFYQHHAGEFWLALSGERVVGSIALLDIGDRLGALRKMFVAADCRGATAGVAGRLLGALIGHARTHGLRAIYLGTTDKFLAAHRFYEKHGFALVDAAMLPASFPRMSVDSRFYRLDLPSHNGDSHG